MIFLAPFAVRSVVSLRNFCNGFYERSDWTEMVGKRVRIQNVVESTREERIQWLKRKKERNIKKRYKRRKQDRERKNIINVKEEK